MSPERQREIAAIGGKKAHAIGKAHKFTPDAAREAGRKGGKLIAERPGHMSTIGRKGGLVVGKDREHMATIGKAGGLAIATQARMSEIGRLGGLAVSRDKKHMSTLGRSGGKAASRRTQERQREMEAAMAADVVQATERQAS
jgi:general stress protein YciG